MVTGAPEVISEVQANNLQNQVIFCGKKTKNKLGSVLKWGKLDIKVKQNSKEFLKLDH